MCGCWGSIKAQECKINFHITIFTASCQCKYTKQDFFSFKNIFDILQKPFIYFSLFILLIYFFIYSFWPFWVDYVIFICIYCVLSLLLFLLSSCIVISICDVFNYFINVLNFGINIISIRLNFSHFVHLRTSYFYRLLLRFTCTAVHHTATFFKNPNL